MIRENGSSASGHRFTVDESSIYWTQQAHDDQRPQFKNDHHKPAAAADVISGRPPTMDSLQPPAPIPPPSTRPPVIYRTDDQLQDDEDVTVDDDHDGNRDDDGDGDKRFESMTRGKYKTAVAESNDFHDYDDGFKDLTTSDRRYRQSTSSDYDHHHGDDDNNWKAKQHRRMSEKRQQDDQDDDDASAADHDECDNGYQMLACPATNNFYTRFRWWQQDGEKAPRFSWLVYYYLSWYFVLMILLLDQKI